MEGSGVEGTGVEWRGGEGRGGKGRAGQGRVPDCLGGLSRVGISSRSTRPWNGQPPSSTDVRTAQPIEARGDQLTAVPVLDNWVSEIVARCLDQRFEGSASSRQ